MTRAAAFESEKILSFMYPKCFKVWVAVEVEGHGGGCELGTGGTGGHEFTEICRGNFTAVGGAEHPATGGKAGHGFGYEFAVVFFNAPNLAFFIAREGGGIQHDGIERAALAGEAVEPVKGVSLAEEML